MINHIWFIKKSDNALLFWLIIYESFSRYNRTGAFNQSEIGNEHAEHIFQSKILNSIKYRLRKKV